MMGSFWITDLERATCMKSGSSVSAFRKQTGNCFFSLSVFITNKWNKRQQNPHNLWICSKIEKTYQPTITVFGPFNTLWASQMSHSDQNCISINILGHVRLLHRSVLAFFFRAPYISYNTKPPRQFTIHTLWRRLRAKRLTYHREIPRAVHPESTYTCAMHEILYHPLFCTLSWILRFRSEPCLGKKILVPIC